MMKGIRASWKIFPILVALVMVASSIVVGASPVNNASNRSSVNISHSNALLSDYMVKGATIVINAFDLDPDGKKILAKNGSCFIIPQIAA